MKHPDKNRKKAEKYNFRAECCHAVEVRRLVKTVPMVFFLVLPFSSLLKSEIMLKRVQDIFEIIQAQV